MVPSPKGAHKEHCLATLKARRASYSPPRMVPDVSRVSLEAYSELMCTQIMKDCVFHGF